MKGKGGCGGKGEVEGCDRKGEGCGVGGVDRDSHVEGCLCCREQVDSGPATVR